MKRTYARVALGPLRLRRPDELPDRVLSREAVAVDRAHLAAYDRVCGFRLRDELPATYPHVLAFPLALELMAGPFPFSPLGVVHIGNRIEQDRPLRADEALDLRVRAENLAPHPRGRQFEVVAEAAVAGATVWRGRSTYLHREGSGGGGGRTDFEPPPLRAMWRVPGDVGRRYAAVSGDRNPIHLHPLAARAFGQKGTIAHGMWTKARCLAALESLRCRPRSPWRCGSRPRCLCRGAPRSASRGDEFFVWDAKSGRPVLDGRTSTPAG